MSTLPSKVPSAKTNGLLHRRFQSERVPLQNRLRVPLGLLGMVPLIVGIEWFITTRPLTFLDPPTFSWRFCADRLTNEATRVDVLCLGDSLVKHGLIPTVLQKASGQTADNASSASSPSPWTYFAFRRALQAGAKPKAIVFDLKPGVLRGGPRYDLQRFQETLTIREAWELYRVSKSQSLGLSLLLGGLPSLRSRLEVRSAVVALLQGRSSKIALLNQVCRRNWSVNGGCNVARKHPEFQDDLTEADQQKLGSDAFAAHKVNSFFAEAIVKTARDRKIRAYLLLAPYSPSVRARRAASGAEAKYEAFVKRLQALDPTLNIIDARDSGYPSSVFVDPTHLDRDGASALSFAVGHVLRLDANAEQGTAGRWIKLPKYEPLGFDPLLEDTEGSRRVLGITLSP